jgi:hypothetical protein
LGKERIGCKVLTGAELSWSPSGNEYILNCDASFKKPRANIGVALRRGYFPIYFASTSVEIASITTSQLVEAYAIAWGLLKTAPLRGLTETCIQTDCIDGFIKVRDYTKKGKAGDKFAAILEKAKALMDDPSATISGVFVPREQNGVADILSRRADRWGKDVERTWTTKFPRRLKATFMRDMTTTLVTLRAAKNESLIEIDFPLLRGIDHWKTPDVELLEGIQDCMSKADKRRTRIMVKWMEGLIMSLST